MTIVGALAILVLIIIYFKCNGDNDVLSERCGEEPPGTVVETNDNVILLTDIFFQECEFKVEPNV